MRIGVVGCGYWGSKHVRVLSGLPDVDQVVVIDPRPDRREDLVRTFPSARAFPTLDEALPYIDGVIIATPPSSHIALGLKAIRAGKHLLVEKPLATTLADAVTLDAEATAARVLLMVGHTFEYNAAVWALHDYIRKDALGRIYYIDSARLNLGLYQSDVNVIWDLAPHDVSVFNYLLGAAPDTVSAWGSAFAHTYHEDVAFVRLAYKELEVTAQLHVSWLDPSKVRRITVVGSQQMAVYNDMADEEKLRVFDKGVAPLTPDEALVGQGLHERPVTYRYGGISSPYVPVQEPLQVQDSHFVACIRDGTQPRTDGASGIAVVRVLAAASLSLREQRVVELQEIQP